jgi:hypothetical protein
MNEEGRSAALEHPILTNFAISLDVGHDGARGSPARMWIWQNFLQVPTSQPYSPEGQNHQLHQQQNV